MAGKKDRLGLKIWQLIEGEAGDLLSQGWGSSQLQYSHVRRRCDTFSSILFPKRNGWIDGYFRPIECHIPHPVRCRVRKLDDQVKHEIKAKVSEFAARGMLQSGVALLAVCTTAANSVSIRAQLALSTLLRCLNAQKTALTPEIGERMKAILTDILNREHHRLREMAAQAGPFAPVFLKTQNQRLSRKLTKRLGAK